MFANEFKVLSTDVIDQIVVKGRLLEQILVMPAVVISCPAISSIVVVSGEPEASTRSTVGLVESKVTVMLLITGPPLI